MSTMSNQHQYMAVNASSLCSGTGDIEHLGHLSEHLGQLCLSQDYSDVVFVVEGQEIPAHKVVLAARSEYFRALLYGGMREANQAEIQLQAPLNAFKALLRYVYSGHMGLSLLKEDTVLDILGLAHLFGFQELETAISDYLRQVLALRNVCSVLDSARLYSLDGLTKYCLNFLDRHAPEVLKHESFFQLSIDALQELLQRDSFFAEEVEVFKAVCGWFNANPSITKSSDCSKQVESILKSVRLPLMSLEELLTVVRPFSLVTPDMLLDAIQEKTHTNSTRLQHRGQLIPEENVATSKHGSAVIQGEMRAALLDGDTQRYDMERGYTRHAIVESGESSGILVKLGVQSIINHIKVLLWDRDNRSYAYYIEVSVDQQDWVRVVDHSTYYCRSWQHLYFEPQVVRYIKLVGTINTVNKSTAEQDCSRRNDALHSSPTLHNHQHVRSELVAEEGIVREQVFHAVALEALHTQTIPPLLNGLVAPKHNVATVDLSATVIEGVSRTRNALLNGDTQHYDWDYGYTCHQLGSGAIVVQLAQPYIIGSLRMLLWDCDYRSYSYYVETSVNYWDWEIVADKSRDTCRSWQVINFPPRPVAIIRIVGTNNSVNEVFHLVHFECPSQEDLPSSSSNQSNNGKGPPGKKFRSCNNPQLHTSTDSSAGTQPHSSTTSSPRPTPPSSPTTPHPPRPPHPACQLPTETALEAEERYDE